MAVLQQQPNQFTPTSVEACIRFRFNVQDHFDTIGNSANFQIIISGNGSDSQTFMTLINITFDGNGSGINSWNETSTSTKEERANAIAAMLQGHPLFFDATISVEPEGFSNYQVNVDFGNQEIADWIFDINTVTGASITEEQGAESVVVTTKKFWYQAVGSNGENLHDKQYLSLPGDQSLSSATIFTVENLLSHFVETTIPNQPVNVLAGTTFVDQTIKKFFRLKYGIVDVADCNQPFLDINITPPYPYVNSAIGLEALFDGMAEYVMQSDNDLVEPLHTYNPLIRNICPDTFCWMWFLTDWADGVTPTTQLNGLYTYFDKDGNTLGTNTLNRTVGDPKYGIAFPCGTANLADINSFGAAYYTVRIFRNGGDKFSKVYTFNIAKGCCCDEEFYFLDKPGGYTTLCLETVGEDLINSGVKVCLNTECDYKALFTGGYRHLGTKSIKQFTSIIKRVFKRDPKLKMYEAFLTSESHYRRYTRGNEDYWQRISINPETLRLVNNKGLVAIEFSWITNGDIKKQSIK